MALTVRDHVVEEELSGLLHDRIGAFGEELAVAGEIVVLGEVERQPRRTHGPNSRGRKVDWNGVSPQVGVVMHDESAGVVVELRYLPAVLADRKSTRLNSS